MSKSKIVLLGLGMQGKAALYDIVNNYDASHIIIADIRTDMESYLGRYPSNLVTYQKIDSANETDLISIMRDADVVIEALPGTFALPVGKLAAKLGVNLVSSMYYINPGERDATKIKAVEEELRLLDDEAKAKGITILTEFGMDPGIDLILAAKALSELDEIEKFYSYGAGFPARYAAHNPLKYKFSWSVIGVMRAYLRPAKIISKGKVVEIDAKDMFSQENIHILDLKEIAAPLECYPNGNSMHYAELFGIEDSVKEMGRFACRWPGHCAFWRKMAQCGFLDEKPIKIGSTMISPIEFTASLLGSQEQFYYADDEKDVALIRVEASGTSKGKKKRIIYQLIDRRDLETNFTAMQRTVGFTMSLGAQLILDGKLKKHGLVSPIEVPFDLVVNGLQRHGMNISREEFPGK